MNRRDFIRGMMAGGVVIAGELWVPGQKLISIPSGKRFSDNHITLIGPEFEEWHLHVDANGMTVRELYWAIQNIFDQAENMPFENPMVATTPERLEITESYRLTEASFQHLHHGCIVERQTKSIYAEYVGFDLQPKPMEKMQMFGPQEPLVYERPDIVFEDLDA